MNDTWIRNGERIGLDPGTQLAVTARGAVVIRVETMDGWVSIPVRDPNLFLGAVRTAGTIAFALDGDLADEEDAR